MVPTLCIPDNTQSLTTLQVQPQRRVQTNIICANNFEILLDALDMIMFNVLIYAKSNDYSTFDTRVVFQTEVGERNKQ